MVLNLWEKAEPFRGGSGDTFEKMRLETFDNGVGCMFHLGNSGCKPSAGSQNPKHQHQEASRSAVALQLPGSDHSFICVFRFLLISILCFIDFVNAGFYSFLHC